MRKEKKITVKPFLNTQLSAQILSDGTKQYPLYLQITFERKNTQIKSLNHIFLDDLDQIKEKNISLLLAEEIKFISTLVLFLSTKNHTEHCLVGLKASYEFYAQPINEIFEAYLKNKLKKAIAHTGSEFQKIIKFEGFDTPFLLILKASKILLDGFSKTLEPEFKQEIDAYKNLHKALQKNAFQNTSYTLLHWCMGTAKAELIPIFEQYFDEDSSEANKTYVILDKIIEFKIKYS